MILSTETRPPETTWLYYHGELFNVDTGEITNELERAITNGSLVVCPNLPNAMEKWAFLLSSLGTLEIYGDNLSAAHLRKWRRGVRFAGLQGYDIAFDSMQHVREFWEFLKSMCLAAGTIPALTAGATSMRIAAALSPQIISSPAYRIQEFSRHAYSAGARHSVGGNYRNAHLYDMHSAYPFVMRSPLPFAMPIRNYKSSFQIHRLTISYNSNLEFSPLWIRAGDNIYHPTQAEKITVTLNSIDIETLRRHGDLKIYRTLDTFGFQCAPLFQPAQEFLDEWQRTAGKYRRAVKILKNSLYGKLAQRATQTHYTLKKITNPREAAQRGDLYKEYNGFEFGLFRRETTARGFVHLPVAGAITAKVRSLVYDAINADTIAVRTDSILSKSQRSDLQIGDAMGEWALQDSGRAVVFGDSGFVINGHSHLDGVQYFDAENFTAQTDTRNKFDFGTDRRIVRWKLAIEKPKNVIAEKNKIKICNSSPAKIVTYKPPPPF